MVQRLFIRKELFRTEFTVVASYNSGSFTKQNETYKKDKIIILENFVFEKMDLDQMRLFTELRLDTVLKESKVTV